jgi:hypothetical protein
MAEVDCKHCGEPFVPQRGFSGQYCTAACQQGARRARTTPTEQSRLVEFAQAKGWTVTTRGDGMTAERRGERVTATFTASGDMLAAQCGDLSSGSVAYAASRFLGGLLADLLKGARA